jgi:hypothetical protein
MKLGRRCRRLPGARSRHPLLFPSLSSLSSKCATSREAAVRPRLLGTRLPASSGICRRGSDFPSPERADPAFPAQAGFPSPARAIPGFPPFTHAFPSPARGFLPMLARVRRPPRAKSTPWRQLWVQGDAIREDAVASSTPWFKKHSDDKASPRRCLGDALKTMI